MCTPACLCMYMQGRWGWKWRVDWRWLKSNCCTRGAVCFIHLMLLLFTEIFCSHFSPLLKQWLHSYYNNKYSYHMYEKLRDIISSNSVPANNSPVVFPSKPQEESSKETQEKYRKLKWEKSTTAFLLAFVFKNILKSRSSPDSTLFRCYLR